MSLRFLDPVYPSGCKLPSLLAQLDTQPYTLIFALQYTIDAFF